jgi:hypothetical protein
VEPIDLIDLIRAPRIPYCEFPFLLCETYNVIDNSDKMYDTLTVISYSAAYTVRYTCIHDNQK